jgi:hypothetical protein
MTLPQGYASMPGLDNKANMNNKINNKEKLVQPPDGKLKILHYRLTQGPFGQMSVEGAVRNISSEVLQIEIKADYLDGGGAYIGSETETIKHLNPGNSTAFDVAYCAKNRFLVKDFRLSVKVLRFNKSIK